MIRVLVFALSLFHACLTPLCAQWQRLPLYGGHAEKLVPSEHNPDEIFALLKENNVYRSTDRGETWNPLPTGITATDFAVSSTGTYFAWSHDQVRISRDGGRSWEKDLTVSQGIYDNTDNGQVIAHREGVVFAHLKRSPLIFVMRDDRRTWDTLSFTFGASGYNESIFVDPENSKFIVAYGHGHLFVSSIDGGNTWRQWNVEKPDMIFAGICSITREGKLRYMSAGVTGYVNDSSFVRFFESLDTGKTWNGICTMKFLNTLDLRNSSIHTKPDGTILFLWRDHIYLSHDMCRTWKEIPQVSAACVAEMDTVFLGSMLDAGLQVSPDGENWTTFRGTRSLPGFDAIEVQAATRDTVFAIITDNPISEFMQSTDGGAVWTKLFESRVLDGLRAVATPTPRYYAVHNMHSVITGIAGQTIPDTVYASQSSIRGFEISPLAASDLFVYTGNDFHFSTDYGRTWAYRPLPPVGQSVVRLFPSRQVRGRVLIVFTTDELLDRVEGAFLVNEYGYEWRQSWHGIFVDVEQTRLYGNDALYYKSEISRDYGMNWSSDSSGNSCGSCPAISSGAHLMKPHDGVWMWHDGLRWRRLRDATGADLGKPCPMSISETGSTLYCGYAYDGLYKIEMPDPTTGLSFVPGPERYGISVAPNPFTSSTEIRFAPPYPGPRELVILDALGRTMLRRAVHGNDGPFVWDGRGRNGYLLPTGMYFCIVSTGAFSIATARIVISR
jgi:photosystem II stability/assembly factor-like uncharacterized protein